MLMFSQYNHSGSYKQSEIALEVNLHVEVKVSKSDCESCNLKFVRCDDHLMKASAKYTLIHHSSAVTIHPPLHQMIT
jgi:plastocyanin domain-containing protein